MRSEEVEKALRSLPNIELLGILRHSSNFTFLARLGDAEDRAGEGLLAVYKPAQGESPLWDFPPGTLYAREVAAYELAKNLGWPLVPPTVVRDQAPHGTGALQLFVPARADLHYLVAQGLPVDRWLEVAVFDVITNNADRKSGHCLIDEATRVWAIDHGLTFHVDYKLRTVIWDFAGQPLPPRIRPDLERAQTQIAGGELSDRLQELLGIREVDRLQERIDTVLDPAWTLPHPQSSWSLPWPPV
jgi:hypothetical protein